MSRSSYSHFSRREVMQTGIMAGVGAAFAPRLWAADLPVLTKAIPSTGEKIPVMGIGTNQFGRTDYDAVRALLKRMSELGGGVIDTAAIYGESEEVIGKALAELKLRKKMFVATKFNAAGATFGPPPGGPPPGGPPPGGAAPPMGAGGPPADPVNGLDSFERSLKRLQTERVDLLMAHFLSSVEPLMPVMLDLKKAGRIRYLGITTVQPSQHAQMIEYMRKYPIDFVQVDYSLGNRAAATDVFPVAMERKIAVMVAVPLGGGRNSLLSETTNRELPKWAADFDATSWSQFFLKYVVSHPAVTCAIPGSSKINHLEDNQAAGHGRLPDAATRKKMEEFWDGKA